MGLVSAFALESAIRMKLMIASFVASGLPVICSGFVISIMLSYT